MRILGHVLVVLLLTITTQLGGLAWLVSLAFRRRWIALGAAYLALWLATIPLAGLGGRVPLPCWGGKLHSHPVACVLNRHYVVPELREVARDLARDMAKAYPGSVTVTLDGGFPFAGMPLLPHLSHADGRKLDLAFYWQDASGRYRAGRSKSPLGYFGFALGPEACGPQAGPLRWDMALLAPLLPDWQPNPGRMQSALAWLARDPRVGKVLVEPHIRDRFAAGQDKLRFQGCNAARHDDHIHLQL